MQKRKLVVHHLFASFVFKGWDPSTKNNHLVGAEGDTWYLHREGTYMVLFAPNRSFHSGGSCVDESSKSLLQTLLCFVFPFANYDDSRVSDNKSRCLQPHGRLLCIQWLLHYIALVTLWHLPYASHWSGGILNPIDSGGIRCTQILKCRLLPIWWS